MGVLLKITDLFKDKQCLMGIHQPPIYCSRPIKVPVKKKLGNDCAQLLTIRYWALTVNTPVNVCARHKTINFTTLSYTMFKLFLLRKMRLYYQ